MPPELDSEPEKLSLKPKSLYSLDYMSTIKKEFTLLPLKLIESELMISLKTRTSITLKEPEELLLSTD